jgi:MFS family permease
MVAMFLAAADQTILASAADDRRILGDLADLSWVVIAYLLAATIAAPLYGHLAIASAGGGCCLARWPFSRGVAGLRAGSDLLLLIVARAVQGLGGGGLMTLAQALIGEHVSPRERGRFSGYFATVFALASTSGPVLGAYLRSTSVGERYLPSTFRWGSSPQSWPCAFRNQLLSVAAGSTPTSQAPCCSRCPRLRYSLRCRREETASSGDRGRWPRSAAGG